MGIKIVVFLLTMVILPMITTWGMFKIMDLIEKPRRMRVASEARRMIRRDG